MPPHSAECCAHAVAALMEDVGAFSAGTVALLPGKWEQHCWSGGFDFHCLSGSLPIG